MAVTGPTLPRRAALVAGAGTALALTGCDGGNGTPRAGSNPAVDAAADPDTTLVDRVVAALRRAERAATAAGSLELAALHRAHLEALDVRAPRGGAPRHGPPVRRTEQRLHATLVAAAEDAASGTLARLLASMSAAVAQRLAVPEKAA